MATLRLTLSGGPLLTASAGRRVCKKGHSRVLYITNQLPWPAHSGGQLRESQLISRVADEFDITLAVVTPHLMRDWEHREEALSFVSALYLAATQSDHNNNDLPDRVRSHQSQEFADIVSPLAQYGAFDLVHLGGYFLDHHLPSVRAVPVLLMSENIEHVLDRRRGRVLAGDDAKWRQARRLETSAWARASACGAVTEADAEHILRAVPSTRVHLVPVGCNHLNRSNASTEEAQWKRLPGRRRVAFVANYSWGPSRDAAWFLLHEVWPAIAAQLPNVDLVLAGADAPQDLAFVVRRTERAILTGPLNDVGALLRQSDLFICPLRFGGGVRMKLLESLYCGCPIVSTPMALEGLPREVHKATLQAQSAGQLAELAADLLKSPSRLADLRVAASRAAAALPTWEEAAESHRSAWVDTAGRQSPWVSMRKRGAALEEGHAEIRQSVGGVSKCC